MKREARPLLSGDGQHALDQYAQVLQHLEDLSPITLRNYLSDLRQFIAWCDVQEDHSFTPQAVAPSLLIRYRDYLQTTLCLKPATVNRTLMSLKRYFAWTKKTQLIQHYPTSPIKFVPKETSPPRHLSDEEEDALVAAVNATGTLRDQTIITLLLHTGLRAQELCILTRQQVHLGKRNGALRLMGKRKRVREVPLNTTARRMLNEYLATLSPECQYLFPSEKTQRPLTGRTLGHLITKYAWAAHVADVSPHDLRHRFGYRMAEVVPLHRLAQIVGHDSLDTTMPIFVARSKIYNRIWRKSCGYKGRRKMQKSLNVFISYSHKDWALREELEAHLSNLKRQNIISSWYDGDIVPGAEWEVQILERLKTAQIILLLLSANFMASEFCYSIEMKEAIARHEAGETCVIPIVLRPIDWKGAPFAKLKMLPTDAKAVTRWPTHDDAFEDILLGIRKVIDHLAEENAPGPFVSSPDQNDGDVASVPFSPNSSLQLLATTQLANLPAFPASTKPVTEMPSSIYEHTDDIAHTLEEQLRRSIEDPSSRRTFILKALSQYPQSLVKWFYVQSKHFREYLSAKIILAIPALVLIVLSFPDLLKPVPLFEWMSSYPVTTPIIGGALVLLFLPLLIISFALEPQNSRKVPIAKKKPRWVIATALATTSFLLSSLLLAVALIRPPGCPMVFCAEIVPQVVTSPQGVHDANLEAFLITKPQSPFFTIPGNPAQYTQTDLPQSIGAVRLDEKPSVSFYHIVIGIRSLQQGRYGVDIMHIGLEVLQTPATPRPLNVWSQGLPQDYHTNPYLAVYNGQLSGSIIPATYTPSPLADVTLLPGEPEQLDIQVNSHVLAYIQFRVQITYRVTNLSRTQTHLLTLPNSFEVIFSNALNWNTYQNQEGHFVRSS